MSEYQFTPMRYLCGWFVRSDGDVQTIDGVVPLEVWIEAGRMGPDQIEMARELKAKAERSAWLSSP